MAKNPSISKLLSEVKAHYKKKGRSHLPWRQTTDPYKILVSEVMLQQTQVGRVIPYYERWIKKYPTAKKLAGAKLSEVLKLWSGLGYNRRGANLHSAAKILSATKVPWEKVLGSPVSRRRLRGGLAGQTIFPATFVALPGVGPYTRGAVEAFAFNKPAVFIETNIRTVFFYFSARGSDASAKIEDKRLLPLVAEALAQSKMQPREFYYALMDYGSFLKGKGVKLNARSKHYTKQSKFEGSNRQKRAALLRNLLAKGASEQEIKKVLHSK